MCNRAPPPGSGNKLTEHVMNNTKQMVSYNVLPQHIAAASFTLPVGRRVCSLSNTFATIPPPILRYPPPWDCINASSRLIKPGVFQLEMCQLGYIEGIVGASSRLSVVEKELWLQRAVGQERFFSLCDLWPCRVKRGGICCTLRPKGSVKTGK